MHLTEGWLLFLVSFMLVALAAWAFRAIEQRFDGRAAHA